MPDPHCSHAAPEPITTVDGEHVGYLCPDCDEALGADWSPDWQRNFFLNGVSGSLSGVAAYWVDEGAELTAPQSGPSQLALDLIAATRMTGNGADVDDEAHRAWVAAARAEVEHFKNAPMPLRLEIAKELGIEVGNEVILLERAGGGVISRDGDQITITRKADHDH